MAHKIECDLRTREGFVDAIEQAGSYIHDHASNLLGEYPSLLNELDIVATFRFDEPPSVEVKRRHIVCSEGLYPQSGANSLEQIAKDMMTCLEAHAEAKLPPHGATVVDHYRERLEALGVAL